MIIHGLHFYLIGSTVGLEQPTYAEQEGSFVNVCAVFNSATERNIMVSFSTIEDGQAQGWLGFK